ncbi:phytoene desaturase family protein [Salipaludibacillus aurantiacus]|uniref:Phytoene desaturase n=1 Tax=Salipaludibacillus aurantiacus TaxID=1601833 RepID=A0A1H9PGF5_9BACI|nr:phytoene desaturase family protein [Salipaludibacillus aurantiacus]SER47234.1 phytoene desaturase [Salipaludibacillus aurantiacus]
MPQRKIAIIGAGPGGLAAAMMLSAKGFQVQIFEKQDYVGGRTSSFTKQGYTFDLGPTFFSMPFILEEIFESSNRRLEDYVTLKKLDPMYTLSFDDLTIKASSDPEKMRQNIEKHFPGYGKNYDRFMNDTRKKMNALLPVLQNKHASLFDYLRLRSLKAIPQLEIGKSLHDVLSKYFDDERLKLSFTFQSKYLGMSPWDCPGAFSILSFMEHEYGVFHPAGGLNQLAKAMAEVVREHGGEIHTGTGVKKFILNGTRDISGLELDNGETIDVDDVVMNADFAQGMSQLVDDEKRRKYKNIKLQKKKYSCSTFMIYAGVNKPVDLDHHTILFSEDYKRNVEEITKSKIMSDDPSVYVQNASITDPSLAPEGKSSLYILAPVPNNFSGIDWHKEKTDFRDLVLDQVEKRAGLTDIRKNMEVEEILTPYEWEFDKHVYKGATFNLAHNLGQMMYFRPHNKLREMNRLWLVGGGTHPGSGLPTIFESAKITADLIARTYGVKEEKA